MTLDRLSGIVEPESPGLEISMPSFLSSRLPATAAGPGLLGSPVELRDQFVIFQFSDQADGPAVFEASKVEPKMAGNDDAPDMLVAMEMLAFNVGDADSIDPQTRATLRMTMGKDESSTDRAFDTVFWTVAAGLRLYDDAKKKAAEAKDLKGDFRASFGRRPIEIPGGLAKLSFEVVQHPEPHWWQRTFSFATSDTGKALVSALGFPAVTYQAIGFLDELLNRIEDSHPKPLFQSIPMQLALSKFARDNFRSQGARVRVGCLSPGFCVLARARDYAAILAADPVYNATYGRLVPSKVSDVQLLGGDFDDPFKTMTYAVLRLGMKATKLDPTFNYG
jgi:hypothetical protein